METKPCKKQTNKNANKINTQTISNKRVKHLIKFVINSGGPNPRKGKKSDQAHPPIHPLKVATGLSGNEARVSNYFT